MSSLWIKIAIIVAILGAVVTTVHAYNNAITEAEQLRQENTVLSGALVASEEAVTQAIEDNKRLNLLLLKREEAIEVIHDVEIKTVEVIKEIQGECIDAAVPGGILTSLRE